MITRYFSTTSAGAADGTSWANRAELLPSGNWSTVITGHDSSVDGGLLALIGPGTYTCSQTLTSALAPNIDTTLNLCILHGCDSSGNLLEPPDPTWTSAQPCWDDTNMPVIQTTTAIPTLTSTVGCRLIKFTSTGRSGIMIENPIFMDWCVVENQMSNNSSGGISAPSTRSLLNTYVKMSGTSYDRGLSVGAISTHNIRIEGNPAATAGERVGLWYLGTSNTSPAVMSQICSFNHPATGFSDRGTNVANTGHVLKSMFINNGGDGMVWSSTASQTSYKRVENCLVTGNGGYGINANTESRVIATKIRARNNTSGNFGNWPDFARFAEDTSAGTDSDEFVNPAIGDFRIKNTSLLWGNGIGIMDEPA